MQSMGARIQVGGDRTVTLQLPDEIPEGEYEMMLVWSRVSDSAHASTASEGDETQAQKPRRFGQFRGQIQMRDDFDEPLPDEFWLGESEEVTS